MGPKTAGTAVERAAKRANVVEHSDLVQGPNQAPDLPDRPKQVSEFQGVPACARGCVKSPKSSKGPK